MKYKVDKNTSKSAYLQIYEQLRKDVVDGIYPYGARLPSKRMIAGEDHTWRILRGHSLGIGYACAYIERAEHSMAEIAAGKSGIFVEKPIEFILTYKAFKPADQPRRDKASQSRQPSREHLPNVNFHFCRCFCDIGGHIFGKINQFS